MKNTIYVDQNKREAVPYVDEGFKLGVWTACYESFIDRTINQHWHYDFEFGLIIKGSADCYINDTHMTLKKDDLYFINSNMLHMSKQAKDCNDAAMFVLTFPTSLLSGTNDSTIFHKYFAPILMMKLEGFIILADDPRGDEIRNILISLYKLNPTGYHLSPSVFGYELECLKLTAQLWIETLKYIENNNSDLLSQTSSMQTTERMKVIITYLHDHYQEKIKIEDIAKHANVSRSECFRCFKQFTNRRIIDYLNEYRLMKAAELLVETNLSITEIFLQCGFESAGYFGKMFKRVYSIPPLQYRKRKTAAY